MSQPIVPLTVPKSRRFEKKSRNEILMKIRLEKVELTFFHSINQEVEKATLFCTIFIKCFLLSGHSLSDGCLIIETTVNAMMIPPVDIVLGFKG